MTLAEILATFPVGSDERSEALAAWRQAEDARLAKNPPPKVPTGKRPGRPLSVPVEPSSHVAASDDARREWERRRDEAQSAKEAEAAAAIRARLKRVVDLTQARLGAVADPKARAAKMVRLSEIQASLAANKDPKTPAIISRSFLEIEARLVVQTKRLVPADWSPQRPYRPHCRHLPVAIGTWIVAVLAYADGNCSDARNVETSRLRLRRSTGTEGPCSSRAASISGPPTFLKFQM